MSSELALADPRFDFTAARAGAAEELLDRLIVGTKLKFRVRGANDTSVGHFSPVAETTVT